MANFAPFYIRALAQGQSVILIALDQLLQNSIIQVEQLKTHVHLAFDELADIHCVHEHFLTRLVDQSTVAILQWLQKQTMRLEQLSGFAELLIQIYL